MGSILSIAGHRPYALATGRWIMRQRWNELLFAHWPVAAAEIARLLPAGLDVDTFDGSAWLGVVPFSMDQVRYRPVGEFAFSIPGTSSFAELNLRTYARSRATGKRGVYFFSLDATSPLAVAGARTIFQLPYYLASIQRSMEGGAIQYRSRRMLTREPVRLAVRYRPVGPAMEPSSPGTLAYFLTERYCLFTSFAGRLLVGEIHHLPWPLEPAEAEFEMNELARPHGLTLPDCPPVLHFSRALQVYLWPLGWEQGG